MTRTLRSLCTLITLVAGLGAAHAQDALTPYSVDGVTHQWSDIGLSNADQSAVLLAQAVTLNGTDDGLARLSANGRVRFQEFANGTHKTETIDVLALRGDLGALGLTGETGTFQFAPVPAANTVDISFANSYANPLVFAHVATQNGGDPISVQVADVRPDGATLLMAEPPAYDGEHLLETFHWLVVEAGDYAAVDGRGVRAMTALHAKQAITHPRQWTPTGWIGPITQTLVAYPEFDLADLGWSDAAIVCRFQSAYADYNALRVTTSHQSGTLRGVSARPLTDLTLTGSSTMAFAPVACLAVEMFECAADADCPTGVCNQANRCTPCTASADCDDGDACTVDVCDVVYVDGAANGTCSTTPVAEPIGLMCDPGTGDFVECLADDDCAGNQRCAPDNTCVRCLDDDDCANGVCNQANICTECTSSAHCDDGDLCTTDICQRVTLNGSTTGTCSAEPMLEPGLTCDPDTGELYECRREADCGYNEFCNADGMCELDCTMPGRVEVGGACWFYGDVGESCTSVCGSHGLAYDSATRDYAGSGGTVDACWEVLSALQALPVYDIPDDNNDNVGSTTARVGCAVQSGGGWFRDVVGTNAGAAPSWPAAYARACACQ